MSICIQEQYIEIVLGKKYFAIKTRDIYKIIKMQVMEDTQKRDSYMNEVLCLHNKEVQVISIRHLFDMPEAVYTKATRIIVVKHNRGYVGIIVDQVNKVSTYDIIQAAPERAGIVRGSYFSGIGQRDGKQVGILKMDEVLLRI